MVITHKLTMNLEGKERSPWIEVSQWDAYTRRISMMLFEGKKAWTLPEDVTVLIQYRKPDGKQGAYDTLPNGETAWSVQAHILTLTLAPQVLTAPGSVMVYASILQGEKILNTFAVEVCVRPAEQHGNDAASEDYFMVTGVLAAPEKADVGQYLRVLEVNGDGKITRLEAAELPEAGVDEEQVRKIVEEYCQENLPSDDESAVVQSDWDQSDDTMPDFVRNKPFGLGKPVVLIDNQTFTMEEGVCTLMSYEMKPDAYYKLTVDGTEHEAYCTQTDFFGTLLAGIGNVEGALDGTMGEDEYALLTMDGELLLAVTGAAQCTVTLVERPLMKLASRFVEMENLKKLTVLDEDPYLYSDLGITKITYDELLAIVKSGAVVAVEHPLGVYTVQYPAMIRFGEEGYASVWTVYPVGGETTFRNYYTAEYAEIT